MSELSKYDMIKLYIDEYDYDGLLACGAPNDEFDSYSRILTGLISDTDTAEDIAQHIANTMDPMFKQEVRPDKFNTTAKKIHAALHGKFGYYDEINPEVAKDKLLSMLKPYGVVVYTNKDKGYESFEEGDYSISLERDGELFLYVDWTDGEFTLGFGGWHTHYEPYSFDFNQLREELNQFIVGKTVVLYIECDGAWMGSCTFEETDITREIAISRVENWYKKGELREKLNKKGFKINCNFFDPERNLTYVVEPGIVGEGS